VRVRKRFVAYFHFTGWSHVSLGLHAHLRLPNIEFHLPFGFLRIGWIETFPDLPLRESAFPCRTYGLLEPGPVPDWCDLPFFPELAGRVRTVREGWCYAQSASPSWVEFAKSQRVILTRGYKLIDGLSGYDDDSLWVYFELSPFRAPTAAVRSSASSK
jgi:hypothetical protein